MEGQLRELIHELTEYYTGKITEVKTLRKVLEDLEKKQEKLVDTVSHDNDPVARQQLAEIDKKIDKQKREYAKVRNEASAKIKQMKLYILDIKEDYINKVEMEIRDAKKEIELIRTETLPKAQNVVDTLNEQLQHLQAEVLTKTNKLNNLERFEFNEEEIEIE